MRRRSSERNSKRRDLVTVERFHFVTPLASRHLFTERPKSSSNSSAIPSRAKRNDRSIRFERQSGKFAPLVFVAPAIVLLLQQLIELVTNLRSLEKYILTYTNTVPLFDEDHLRSSRNSIDFPLLFIAFDRRTNALDAASQRIIVGEQKKSKQSQCE